MLTPRYNVQNGMCRLYVDEVVFGCKTSVTAVVTQSYILSDVGQPILAKDQKYPRISFTALLFCLRQPKIVQCV